MRPRSARHRQSLRRSASVRRARRTAPQRAFTLTEMLVATALTLIILLMFAQIYRSATSTIREQRGLAQNDARARTLATLLRTDLQKMTFRDSADSTEAGLLPLGPDDLVDSAQSGFFYYSENETGNDVDDVIHFTVNVDQTKRNGDKHPYLGKSSRIGRPAGVPGAGSTNARDINQPDFDDGDGGNGATRSRAAEVVYFVRNGVLYRRVLLLRDPPARDRSFPEADNPQFQIPGNMPPTGDLLLTREGYDGNADLGGENDFWNDFDHSAVFIWTDADGDGTRDPVPNGGPLPHDSYETHFFGLESLDNTPSLGTSNYPLALPRHRFGSFYGDASLAFTPRWIREYATEDVNANNSLDGGEDRNGNGTIDVQFIGRFTQEETSNPAFKWPGTDDPSIAPHALTRALAMNPSGTGTQGVVLDYANGPRLGEDLLLTNVDGFDVKIWDPGVQAFVDLGANPTAGYFNHVNSFATTNPGILSVYSPPLSSLAQRGADGAYGRAGIDDDGNMMTDDASELGWPGSDDRVTRVFDTWHTAAGSVPPIRPLYYDPAAVDNLDRDPMSMSPNSPDGTFADNRWQANSVYSQGDVIFPIFEISQGLGADDEPGVAGVDDNGGGIIDRSPPNTYSDIDFFEVGWPTLASDDVPYDGICYVAQNSGTTGSERPSFSKSFGEQITDNLGTGSSATPIVWKPFDNRVGVTRLQITVRYRDVASNLPRQLTIEHSFTDGQ